MKPMRIKATSKFTIDDLCHAMDVAHSTKRGLYVDHISEEVLNRVPKKNVDDLVTIDTDVFATSVVDDTLAVYKTFSMSDDFKIGVLFSEFANKDTAIKVNLALNTLGYNTALLHQEVGMPIEEVLEHNAETLSKCNVIILTTGIDLTFAKYIEKYTDKSLITLPVSSELDVFDEDFHIGTSGYFVEIDDVFGAANAAIEASKLHKYKDVGLFVTSSEESDTSLDGLEDYE